jgi:DNA-binding NarL/FixJ family response regulator
VAVGDTIISEQGLVAIIGRDARYHVCGAAHTFEEANKLVRQHRPDVLLIEPFLENRDAIRWIKDLALEFPRLRILVVSRQSERVYAERALCAGASGYWMKSNSVKKLMHAIETVLAGEIYGSRAMMHGREIVLLALCYAGEPAEGEKLIAPLRKFGTVLGEHVGVQPYVA